jgi:hypothetical protein
MHPTKCNYYCYVKSSYEVVTFCLKCTVVFIRKNKKNCNWLSWGPLLSSLHIEPFGGPSLSKRLLQFFSKSSCFYLKNRKNCNYGAHFLKRETLKIPPHHVLDNGAAELSLTWARFPSSSAEQCLVLLRGPALQACIRYYSLA